MTMPQPNNPTASAQFQDIQRLTRLLDAAIRKIDEDAHLIASLSADLKRHRDSICVSCKERVLLSASLTTTALPQSAVFSTPSEPTGSTVAPSDPELPLHSSDITESKPSSPLALSLPGNYDGPGPETPSDASFHTASQSIWDPFNTSLDLVSPTLMAPVVSVDYNLETTQTLVLSVVKIFTFTASVRCVKFSRDGKYFSVALSNEETHIYDMITMSKSVLVEHSTSVIYSVAMASLKERSDLWTVRFSLDGKYIATGGTHGQIKIWEIKRKRIRAVFTGHTSRIRCIDFSPDGRFLASASYDHTVRVWLVRDGSSKCLSHATIAFDFNSVAFSPDGRYIAAGNDDKHLRIWDACTGHLLKIWKGHTDNVWSVAFRPDGKGMVSGGSDRTWKSWDLSSLQGSHQSGSSGYIVNGEAEETITCKGHTDAVTSFSFSPDSRWVVTSSLDRTSRIWDTTTGVWVCTLKGHTSSVWAADFSPAEPYLVTGGIDRKVMLWGYREAEE